ncbi:hypothetical protein KKA02_02185, partial [Patescibacteria group bacterium]|nr:hypothetical protein [Patescibacteria group bacterium]
SGASIKIAHKNRRQAEGGAQGTAVRSPSPRGARDPNNYQNEFGHFPKSSHTVRIQKFQNFSLACRPSRGAMRRAFCNL